MQTPLPYLIVLAGFAAVLAALAWLARYIRRRGSAGGGLSGALAAYEEAFRATGHASHHEIRQQAERKAPTGSPRPKKT
ncbi:hypothetical protein ABTY98_07690 [Streptomyces sp. NPDC096040]|uniref:hypothetical protein n=1 Tax=Streptomyces sp. NPDC096040 TaxID=3155541 RepID=UPI00333034F5